MLDIGKFAKTKKVDTEKIAKRSKFTACVKVMNYNRLMPTRYSLDVEALKLLVDIPVFATPTSFLEASESRVVSGKAMAEELLDRYCFYCSAVCKVGKL